MKVSIKVEFEVEAVNADDKEHMQVGHAEAAAEEATRQFLSFCEISGYASDVEIVEVHVDGFGTCRVKLCES